MSIAALNWAMEQKTDGPSAQAVLWLIADRANEHGICRHADPDTIAAKTRQSRATVFRRLEEAERVGLLTRLVRHLDDGRREYEVRLATQRFVNFRVDKHRNITLFALDDDKCEGDPIAVLPFGGGQPQDIDGESQIETHGEYQIETEQVAQARLHESQSCDSQDSLVKSPSKNPKESPLPPKGGDPQRIDEESEAKDWPGSDGWPGFERSWSEPILRQSIARQVWSALTPDERTLAIKAARGYMLWRRSQKKPPNVINAHTFLRETDAWAGFAKQVPPEVVKTSPAAFIAEGSDGWRALRVMAAIGDEVPPVGRAIEGYGRGLMRFKDLTPQQLGLARFAIESDGKIDTLNWQIVKAGTNQSGAWRELTGHEPFNVWTGETKRMEVGSKVYENWKVMVLGLRVPAEWPPRKDGSLYERDVGDGMSGHGEAN